MARFIDHSERGQLFLALSQWHGVSGLDRLTLMQLIGSKRLFVEGNQLFADVAMEEVARLLGRSLSTVRASLSGLRAAGLVARDGAGRTVLDLTATMRAVMSPLMEAVMPAATAVPSIDATTSADAPISAHPDSGVADLLAQLSAGGAGGFDESDEFSAGPRQNSGGSIPYRKSQELYKNTTDLDSGPDVEFSAGELHALIVRLRSEGFDHFANAPLLGRFLDQLEAGLDDDWSDLDLIRAATERALQRTMTACAAGPGVSGTLIVEGGDRYGAGLLLHAIYAMIEGRAPKGLLITILRQPQARVSYSMFSIQKALNRVHEEKRGAEMRAEHRAESERVERDKARAGELVQRLCEIVATSPLVVSDERDDVRAAAKRGLLLGQAKYEASTGAETLCIALPRTPDAVLWQYIVDRASTCLRAHGLPHVQVRSGALVGSGHIRIAEARGH